MEVKVNEAFMYDLMTLQNGIKELRENLHFVKQLAATVESRKETFKRKNTHITNPASIDRMFLEEIHQFGDKAKTGYQTAQVGCNSLGMTMFELDIDGYVNDCIKNEPQRKL